MRTAYSTKAKSPDHLVDTLLEWRRKGKLIETRDSAELRSVFFYPCPTGPQAIEVSLWQIREWGYSKLFGTPELRLDFAHLLSGGGSLAEVLFSIGTKDDPLGVGQSFKSTGEEELKMTYLIQVETPDGPKLYGEDDGGHFLDEQDAFEAATEHFGRSIAPIALTWSIVPVHRLGTISGS